MATLTVQDIITTGLSPSLSAAAGGGDEFANTGKEYLEIVNADVSAMTLTVVTQQTVAGLAVADRTVSVPAGEARKIGPFSKSLYNDSGEKVQLTYSAVTSLTVGVFKFG